MLIDHIAATVIIRILKFGGYNDGLYQLYRVMRNIGRIAFPIFPLVEGVMHTRDREKICTASGMFCGSIWDPVWSGIQRKSFGSRISECVFYIIAGSAYHDGVWCGDEPEPLECLEADGIIYDCNPCRNVCGRVFINGLRRTRSSLHYGILPVPEKQNTAGRVWMSGICMVGMGSSVCIRSNLLLQWKTWLWNEIFLLRILSGASADPVSDRI